MIYNFDQIIEKINNFEPRNSILYDLIDVISPQKQYYSISTVCSTTFIQNA